MKSMKRWPRMTISIHALREEGDSGAAYFPLADRNFNPRPPRGGRLDGDEPELKDKKISIHALREEGDSWSARAVPRS